MLKGFIQKITACAMLLAFLSGTSFAVDDFHVENQPQVIEAAFLCEQRGVLKQKDNGYLYLDVSNDFIAKTLPLIQAEGKIVPPRHYTSKKGIGAHISVMYENEQIENEIWEIKELGNEYNFYVQELRTVKFSSKGKMKKLWLIAVFAPELEKLRESYGLASKLKGHDFHITIGSQVPGIAKPDCFIIELEEEEKEAA